MVDAVVSLAVNKLGEFLENKVVLRRSLKDNVEWLRTELRHMEAYLTEAEEKQALSDRRVQQIQLDINSAAEEAITILDTYNSMSRDGDDHGCAGRLKAYACFCRKEAKFYTVGEEIQSLKQRVMEISHRRQTYGIPDTIINAGEGPSSNTRSSMVTAMRRTTSYLDEDHFLIGFEEVVEKLLAQLLNREPRRSVISIYGMGGLGKTTLAKALYNSPSVIGCFSTRAWICVTEDYTSPDDHLRSVIKTMEGCTKETLDLLEKMTQTDLESHLRCLLKERKYLLVVDDVWHKEAWECLRRAFPDSKNGSRIIITTRNQDVAESADRQGFPHKLHFLSQAESWNLFCEKLRSVNMSDDEIWYLSPQMEGIAREMVKRCGGLPLTINLLGGLLCNKEGLEEWQRVKARIWMHMQNDSMDHISPILTLSYNDLSAKLRQCFLYIGMYPEDRVFETEKLKCLWMAEGLLISEVGEEMEDIGERFVKELTRRSLIQVERTLLGKDTHCKIHDLLRDLVVKKAKRISFLAFMVKETPFPSQTTDTQFILEHKDIQGTRIAELPDDIGNLVNLRFLCLTNTHVSGLPPSIGKLINLQTLDAFVYDRVCKLPPQISNLVNLRHLRACNDQPLQLSKLTSLRTLIFENCDQFKDDDAIDLPNLQELVMGEMRPHYSLNAIGSLKNLTILMMDSVEEFPPLEPLSSCENLNKLWLRGKIERLPLLPKLITEMVLEYSQLETDPMPVLGALENLRDLRLVGAYNGKEFTCSEDSFGQLKFLRIEYLWNLERWNLATSAMPLIKSVGIYGCHKLREIPERLTNIAFLGTPKITYFHRF